MTRAITSCIVGLGLLLGGCTTVRRGVVVKKSSRVDLTKFPRIANYWVDVRGRNGQGVKVTDRVLLFKNDWRRISVGDVISPEDYGVIVLPIALNKLALKLGPNRARRAGVSSARTAPAEKSPPQVAERSAKMKAAPKSAKVTEAEFEAVEARAHEDGHVREAKRKVHSATTPEEQSRAWEEYRRTYYEKMRELAPALRERIDEAEGSNE